MQISTETSEPVPAHLASRETRIGFIAAALAVVGMFADHLLDEGGGLAADPPMFALGSALSLALAAYLFGRYVPRTAGDPRAALRLAVFTVLSVPTMWLGLPMVVGGAAVALGLAARDGSGRGRATVAVVIGVLAWLLGLGVAIGQVLAKL